MSSLVISYLLMGLILAFFFVDLEEETDRQIKENLDRVTKLRQNGVSESTIRKITKSALIFGLLTLWPITVFNNLIK